MNGTVRLKASQITKDWRVIDAAGRPLGRVASEAAALLRGKHKPTFEPHLDGGDYVIIVNASKVVLTGRKAEQRKFYRHSGYPGGLKSRTWEEQFGRHPDRVLEKSVWGMLPKGTLGEQMLKHLKVYKGPDHPHQSQIIGSERAVAAREGLDPLAPSRRKVRFVPLPAAEAPAPVAEAAPARKPRKRAAPKAAAPVAEAAPAVAEAPAAEVPAPAAEEAPKPARRTRAKAAGVTAKAAGATAKAAAAEETPKPARRTRAKAAGTTAKSAAAETEAPKRRATRKKAEAPEAEAPTTEEKKPAPRRRRAAPKAQE